MDKLTIMTIICVVAAVGALVGIDNTTAGQSSVEEIHYSVSVPSDFLPISPGETLIVNAVVVSDSPSNLRLKMTVTVW